LVVLSIGKPIEVADVSEQTIEAGRRQLQDALKMSEACAADMLGLAHASEV
jgi:hypothetical protein